MGGVECVSNDGRKWSEMEDPMFLFDSTRRCVAGARGSREFVALKCGFQARMKLLKGRSLAAISRP